MDRLKHSDMIDADRDATIYVMLTSKDTKNVSVSVCVYRVILMS